MSVSKKLMVEVVNYGDGYIHRNTRGLNPVRPSFQVQFPFISDQELSNMDSFLTSNAAQGFWFAPPNQSPIFVTVDEWGYNIEIVRRSDGVCGQMQMTMVQQFNLQPVTPPTIAPPAEPISVTGNMTVGSEAHQKGIVQNGAAAYVTFDAAMQKGTIIPWLRLGDGLVFTVGGNGVIIVEMTGYDRAWVINSAGTAWCVENTDGNSPVISLNGDLSGPSS
jgi:phage-related protein